MLFRRPPSKDAATTTLRVDDFHNRNVHDPISISATFDSLSEAAASDLKHYVRQGQLIVRVEATWDVQTQSATIRQVGRRIVMPQFAQFFAKDHDGAGVKELRNVYGSLRARYPELPETNIKSEMHAALREYEEAHPSLGEEKESRDEFYGATGSLGVLAKHLVWIHVPAAKDATGEAAEQKNNWLGQLIQQVVRSRTDFDHELEGVRSTAAAAYREIIKQRQSQLAVLSESLTNRMKEWAHPDARLSVCWSDIDETAIGLSKPSAQIEAADGNFDGPLSCHGHGFQRSYLVSLLQELAETTASGAPTMILGIEEPELYQHPPQARHLANELERFSVRKGQVVVCTHSPYFISGSGFPSVRLLRRAFSGGVRRTELSHASLDAVRRRLEGAGGKPSLSTEGTRIKLHQQLHPAANELFFAPVVILVEGGEDLAHITTQLQLSNLDDEFRRLGCHIIPADRKSNMPLLRAVAASLGIPTFTVFDGDADKCDKPSDRGHHERDNGALLKLGGHPSESAIPSVDVWEPNLVMWRTDLTSVFRADVGEEALSTARERIRCRDGLIDADLNKSVLFAGAVVEELWASGKRSANLVRLCGQILEFARSRTGRPGATGAPSGTTPSS